MPPPQPRINTVRRRPTRTAKLQPEQFANSTLWPEAKTVGLQDCSGETCSLSEETQAPQMTATRLPHSRQRCKQWGCLMSMCDAFPRSSHASGLRIGLPVATLPGAWRCRISTGTGWSGVSMLWLGEIESLICNVLLSVAARTTV